MSDRNINRRILSLVSLCFIVSILTFHVAAANVTDSQTQFQSTNLDVISPLWNNVSKSNLNLTFSNKKIYAKITLNGIKGTKYKNGTVTVSKYSGGKYVPIKTWTKLSSSNLLFLFSNSDLTATSGVKYKLSIKITAYTSTNSEEISLSKVATCP